MENGKAIALAIICFLQPYILFALSPEDAFFQKTKSGNRCLITERIDLGGASIPLHDVASICFSGDGAISNGILIGNDTRISRESSAPVFSNVRLEGSWSGFCSDDFFMNDPGPEDDWDLVSSVMKFNDVTFHCVDYYLAWEPILMNSGDVTVNGNGVRFHVASDKGSSRITAWGRRYDKECLFSSRTSGGRFRMADIRILDNSSMDPDFGSDVSAVVPYLYYYLAPTQATVELYNVDSDGQGSLLEIYNYRQNITKVVMRDCDIRTSQFAVEIANVKKEDSTGHTDLFICEGCSFFRYPNAILCGPVSLVGVDGGMDMVVFNDCVLVESNAGNIEMSGVRNAVFSSNICTNLCFYDGDNPPELMTCSGNILNLVEIEDRKKGRSLGLSGEKLLVRGNTVNVMEEGYPTLVVAFPHKVRTLRLVDNEIHYYPGRKRDSVERLIRIDVPKNRVVSKNNIVLQ